MQTADQQQTRTQESAWVTRLRQKQTFTKINNKEIPDRNDLKERKKLNINNVTN